ncbi:MAG: DUF2778 domain-containing protein [Planctomycetes bacterium]|nr:DUF2778 domain-containing protein [Planctomycetota bacterium]
MSEGELSTQLVYDGREIKWGQLWFEASSGLIDHQSAGEQCQSDKGPIPAGLYRISLDVDSDAVAKTDKYGQMVPSTKIQRVPESLSPTWGYNRVRLELIKLDANCASPRDGFYLHDSHKGFTHGCIETTDFFFGTLREYAKSHKNQQLTLRVRYPTADASTKGDTYRPSDQ